MGTAGISFQVSNWTSWQTLPGSDEKADVSAVPAMLRRRLNALGRACASQALPAMVAQPDMPVVYCSRHGDIQRTASILLDLAERDEVSPKNFSLAVHNAICGILSIHADVRAPINALAAGSEALVPLLLEGLGMLGPQHPTVLCIDCDDELPEPYTVEDAVAAEQGTHAAAFLLHYNHATATRLALANEGELVEQDATAEPGTALQFCQYLSTEQATMAIRHNGCQWGIRRC